MNWSTAWLSWAPQLLALWLLLFLAPDAVLARQENNEVTPAVQQLFLRAKAAQQQGDAAAAIEDYQAIVKLAPHLAPAYNNLGMLYLKDRDYTRAVDVLKRALELDPNMHTASGMLGMSYFHLGVNEKAEPLLREALGSNPKDDNVEMTLALTLMDLKKYGEAASHLNSFLNRNPKSVDGWYLLRKTYLQMSEDARTKINEIDPDSVVAHEIAGEIDESVLNYAGAMAEYKKAIDKAPHQPGTHMAMGNVYWHIGKWESAQGEFKAELANNQNNCDARWKLADAMLEANGSSEDALSELNESIDLCPTLMQAHVDRARALIRLSKQSDALPDLLMAERDNPAEPSIHFLLASVYRAQGKAAEAQQEVRTFEQLQGQSTRDTVPR
jgi:tetratricopeptide (TPR) repeat protein